MKDPEFSWAEVDGITGDNLNCREIKHYIETTYDTNKFDLVAQKNDAILAKALNKSPTKIVTEEDDGDSKGMKVQQCIPYEG